MAVVVLDSTILELLATLGLQRLAAPARSLQSSALDLLPPLGITVAMVIPRSYPVPMKVEVSVPDAIFEAAERLAKQRHVPRSQLFAEALQEYVARHGGDAITAKLNELYALEDSTVDAALTRTQLAAIDHETW